MPQFQIRRRVPFSPQQMFALVADVERYPEFLPLCEDLTVRSRQSAPGVEVLLATMHVGYGAIHESFTSRVSLDPATPRVVSEHVEGPFRYMTNRWGFHPAPDGQCEIDFSIDYEFSSLMLQMLVGSMFETAFRRFTEAFEDRAHEVYGQKA